MDPYQFRLAMFLGVLAAMYAAESFWAVRKWETPRFKRLLFHGAISAFNTVFTRLVVTIPLLFWLHFLQERQWGLSHVLGLQGTSEIGVTFVLFDCFDYWWHRFNHRVPFLWRFHRAHHLDTHVDVTTSLRFHPGELVWSGLAKAVWIFAWGPSLWGFILAEAGITAYSQFHHSNIDFKDSMERWLRLIHITPRIHAAHHTVTVRTRDANYSTIFSVWDRIFRTFREPDFEEMKNLGLTEGRKTYLSFFVFLKSPINFFGKEDA